MYKNTIVKIPSESYITGLTTADLGRPIFEKALEQHKKYVEGLKKCGTEVTISFLVIYNFLIQPSLRITAVLTPKFAVISNPGALSRNGEIHEMEPIIKSFYETIYSIQSPGTLDGGDILQIEDHFYIGISARTNLDGAEQLKKVLESEGYKGTIVYLEKFFHLKTGITYFRKSNDCGRWRIY